MNLLVVDFDFFVPVVERPEDSRFNGEWSFYDWSHSEEDRVFYETIWQFRAMDFMRAGRPLPRADDAALAAFWQRFRFAPHAQLLTADSNMYAAHIRVRRGVDSVWLYDAHHDAGYQHDALERARATGEFTCENWMLAYFLQGARLHMRYPAWRHYGPEIEPRPAVTAIDRRVDDGTNPEVTFDRVFLCKSPAWVPAWVDDQWAAFLAAAPLRRKVSIDEAKLVRAFDRQALEARASEEAAMLSGISEIRGQDAESARG